MAVLSPAAKLAFVDAAGQPLVNGKLYTYIAGTTTLQATYADSSGAAANTNPIILDSMLLIRSPASTRRAACT